ncbi:MAG: IS66 family transposase [Pseudonocardiaceae bacterium]
MRVIHRRKKYRRSCSCASKAVVVAPVVGKPIRKGLFSAGFLARLVHEKYVLGRPVARVLAALGADGPELSKGSLCGVLKAVSDPLEPLDQAIRERNAKAAHLHIDETRWEVFEELEGKKVHRWYLWVFVAIDTAVFHIDPTRSGAVVESHLGIDLSSGALKPGRSLIVSSDFYAVYQSLSRC